MRTVAILVVGLLMFFGGLVSGLLLPTTMTPKATSAVQETWDFTNVTSSQGANGWIAITVNNTGIVPVTFVKVSVNLVAQSTSPSLPITLQPDTGTVLNITMNVDYVQYDIRVYTSRGNYSEIQWTPPVIRQAGVRLYKANISWDENNHQEIYIDIGNSGPLDTQIIQVYVGTSPSNLQNYTSPSLPLACNAGAAVVTITVNYNWTAGATYYFKVLSSSGQYIDTWAEQAPPF